jgi:hypothetical protein
MKSVSDEEQGPLIGKYQRRGDATKVVKEIVLIRLTPTPTLTERGSIRAGKDLRQ